MSPPRRWMPWLVSVIAHGLIALVVRQGRWGWPGSVVPPTERVELDIFSARPEPEATVEPASVIGVPRALAVKPRPAAALSAPAPPATTRVPDVAPRSPSAVEVAPSPPGASAPVPSWMHTRGGVAEPDAPAASPAPPSAGAPTNDRALALSWDGLSPAARDRLAGPAPAGVRRSTPRWTVDQVRAAREREDDARANVRVGRVDPFLHDYVRDARERFEDAARRIAEQLSLDAQKSVEAWGHGYLKRVDQVNRQAADALAGARHAADARGDGPPPPSTERRPDLFAAYDEATHGAASGAVERQVTVCLTVVAGQEPTVALKQRSGEVALDRLALDAFSHSALARPAPADAHAAVACYDLRISAYRIPPLPVLSCGIDKNGPSCTWPFKKITSASVHLDSVEYPAETGDDSLLRRAH